MEIKLSNRSIFAIAAVLSLVGPARAQESPAVFAHEASHPVWEPTQKNIVGNQDYFSNDTSLLIDLPRGFNVSASYSFYKSDASSRTATIYLGVGKDWADGFLNFTYSWTPLVNNYRSHAYEFKGAYFTPSADFRTTIGATFNTTYNTELIISPGPKKGTTVTNPLDIRQMTGTLNLKQRIYDTKLTADFGKSSYDREISRLSSKISPNSTRLQGLSGLLQGFPDMEWKLGVYRYVGDTVTVWGTYDHIRLLVAAQSSHGNSDSYMVGTDYYPWDWVTATLQYNYVTQTGQPPLDLYGLSLAFRF